MHARRPPQHMRGLWWSLFFGFIALCSELACSGYQAQPIDDARIEAALASPSMEAAEIQAGELRHPILRPVVLDDSDGLSPDEAAILAVLQHPELRALRHQHQVASAQIIEAGLLPNPQLSGSIDLPTDGPTEDTTLAYGVALSYDFSELAGRGARIQASELAIQSVDLEIAWQEWQLAQEARMNAYRLIALSRDLELARDAERVWLAQADRMRQVVAAAEATSLDSASAEVGYQDAVLARLDIEQQIVQARLALNAAIGVPPDASLDVDLTAPLLSFDTLPSTADLISALPERRLDLIALRRAAESQDAQLQAAVAARFPPLSIEINRARDTGGLGTLGLAVGIDLPLFSRNQGEIAAGQAERDQLHDDYLSRLIEARNQVALIMADIQATRAQLATVDAALPALEQLSLSIRQAASIGQVNVLVADEAQQRFLSVRLARSQLEATVIELGVTLELACGTYLGSPMTSQHTSDSIQEQTP